METLLYVADGFWRQIGDLRVHPKYPLVAGGPIPVLSIMGIYLYYVRVLGPKWMKFKEPYDLKWIIRVYNIMMSLVNFYMFYHIAILTNYGSNYFGCEKAELNQELLDIAYLYFVTKIIELLDTVFFILRKKPNQASNLHVFHHSHMIICVWIYFKAAPSGSSVVFPFINSGVHTMMYFYYFLATFKGMQNHLWWKRHLTEAQLIQFLISMVHFAFQGLSTCEYPRSLTLIGFTLNFVFVILFSKFYYYAYLKTKAMPATNSLDQPPSTNDQQRVVNGSMLRARSHRQVDLS